MDAEIARLCKFLADIKQLLDEAGEARWAAWIGRDLTLVENLDAYGLEGNAPVFHGRQK